MRTRCSSVDRAPCVARSRWFSRRGGADREGAGSNPAIASRILHPGRQDTTLGSRGDPRQNATVLLQPRMIHA